MSQKLDILKDAAGRIVRLSGSFTKQTNSNEAGDHYAPEPVTITVPEDMEAHLSAAMTVDDWGYIDVTPLSGTGSKVRIINLTDEVESPGPRNGHVRWSAQTDEAIALQPGQYNIEVRQDNAPYSKEYAHAIGNNVSFCEVEATIGYVAIQPPRKTISAHAKLEASAGVYPLKMNKDIELLADVAGHGENTTITNLRIGNYDNTPAIDVSPKGAVCQISIVSLNAEFITDTVISTSVGMAVRRARLFWTVRIIDPLDSVNGTDRTVSNSTEIAQPDPVFSVALN